MRNIVMQRKNVAEKLKTKAKKMFARYSNNKKKYCVICKEKIGYFIPYRGGSVCRPSLMKSLDVIGSDVDNFSCPVCGATDRERHLYLYLQKMQLIDGLEDSSVLHFAPEKKLSEIIMQCCPSLYIKADLYPVSDDIVKVDLLELPYDDRSFDWVIANHVLEHVADPLKAVREIHRVLKANGFAIIQTPYSRKLEHELYIPEVDDDAGRLQLYGQEDHVRLFGRDIFQQIASAGLIDKTERHEDLLGDITSETYGINPNEPFFLFQRK
jgi:predicted SAM-dependent methyltransferase